MKRLFVLLLFFISTPVWAAGTAGLNYQTYAAGGARPTYTQDTNGTIIDRTLLSTGTVSTVNYNWGGNSVLNSGRAEGVIVRFYGFINIPAAGTYSFGGNADDGIRIKVNGISVVDSWIESGGAFRSGSIALSGGAVPIELIYYENGGGAMVNLQWLIDGSWQIVQSTSLATSSDYWVPAQPALCCGGSNASFSATAAQNSRVQAFTNRGTGDSQINIEQIGNSNTVTVNQTGTNQNYLDYSGNGSFNTVNVTQSGNSATVANYIELGITGNSNTVNLTQTSTGGTKSIFATVNDNNNSLTIQQRDSGSHYANVTVSGGNKSVDITQQGSAAHMANVNLSGNSTGLNLTQSGGTQQFYSITHTCSTAGGCGTITVQQGQ